MAAVLRAACGCHGRFGVSALAGGAAAVDGARTARLPELGNSTPREETYPQLEAKIMLDKQAIMELNAAFDSNIGQRK